MKQYYNEVTQEWYTEGQSLTRRIENGMFSGVPSVEQLLSWGFVERTEPEPTSEETEDMKLFYPTTGGSS